MSPDATIGAPGSAVGSPGATVSSWVCCAGASCGFEGPVSSGLSDSSESSESIDSSCNSNVSVVDGDMSLYCRLGLRPSNARFGGLVYRFGHGCIEQLLNV